MTPSTSPPLPRPSVAVQMLLAAVTVGIAVLAFSDLPNPLPTWPTLGPVPINPELLVSGALAVVTLVVAVRDGPSIGTVATGALAILTGFLAAISWHTLFVGSASGVFWGGFFTLLAGVALSGAIVARHVARQLGFDPLDALDAVSMFGQ